MNNKNQTKESTRREAIKTVAYVVPVILTLTARPAKASGGSGRGQADSYSHDSDG